MLATNVEYVLEGNNMCKIYLQNKHWNNTNTLNYIYIQA